MTCGSASCRTWTAPIFSTPSTTSTPPRRCSSSRPRPSRRWRRLTNAHAARAWLVAGSAATSGGGEALRRGLDERGEGGRVRHRRREHVRVLGLGRRPLLDVVGDRPVVDARDRARATSAICSRVRTRWMSTSARRRSRRTCRVDGIARLLVPRLPRRAVAGSRAVLAGVGEVAVVPAAARDGEQRQVGACRRLAGRRPRAARSCGAPLVRTGSTPTSSCCTRARRWCRSTSSASITPSPVTCSGDQQDLLNANLFAQAEALAFGTDDPTLPPYRVMPGNRPSSTLIASQLTPFALGALVAAYEHKVMTLGTIWGIDSFDQWGVELGKKLAQKIAGEIAASDDAELGARRLDQRPDPALSQPFLLGWRYGSADHRDDARRRRRRHPFLRMQPFAHGHGHRGVHRRFAHRCPPARRARRSACSTRAPPR